MLEDDVGGRRIHHGDWRRRSVRQPGMKNDFANAANYVEYPQDNIHVALPMMQQSVS